MTEYELIEKMAGEISGAPWPLPWSYTKARAALRAIREAGCEVVPKKCFIPLTNGGATLVSEDDVERVLAAGSWFAVKKGNLRYVCRGFGRNNRVYLHRFIIDAPKGKHVDHINGDTMDNRRGNLRAVTASENSRNRKGAQINSKSGVRGVYKHRQKWAAIIRHERKNIHLGLFETIEEAAAARAAKEAEIWSHADRYRAMLSASPLKGET
jgi:hypothetical protein